MNHQLEHVDHPLLNVFNRERKNISGYMYELRIHPTLPFAIIKEQKRLETGIPATTIWSLTWREDIEKNSPKMVKILSEKSIGYKFSYDGKWLWFIDSSTSPRSIILMPVVPNLPYFIGNPIYLGEVPRPENANGDAMTRNPSGFVMSGCEGYKDQCWLKKWDFTEAEKLIEKKK
jgi:hypothetical protein